MCYSAQVTESFKKLERDFGAKPDWPAIRELFWRRIHEKAIKLPKALELNFEEPKSREGDEIRQFILEYRANQTRELELELFKQKKRLGDAERTLKDKQTKKALDDQRIATTKIDQIVKRIADVNRTEPKERDSRIFPMMYSLIVVDEGNGPTILPARYHCRPKGKPEIFDRKLPGLYNARRDSLTNFWKELFGHHHAIMQVSSFWENVSKARYDRRELAAGEEDENIVIQFNPTPPVEMTIACLWSRWDDKLVSFSALTDEPTPVIQAAGHDRFIVALKPQYVHAWLRPEGQTADTFFAMFDDREQPHFEHRMAA